MALEPLRNSSVGTRLAGFLNGCSSLATLRCSAKQISSQAGQRENAGRRIQSLDSASGSTFGADPDWEEELPAEPQGFCKDHRPGFKPVAVELIVAQQAGG